jgi:Ca2+-binding RTX toxin-like protein
MRRFARTWTAAATALAACCPAPSLTAGALDPAGEGQGRPAPSCAEGPTTHGDVILGTPCDDVIRVPPGVATVDAGGGDDKIVPAPVSLAADCPEGCFLGVGSQTFEGGPGDDVVYGQRGNDRLFGGPGDDRLYGGIGDDRLSGGPGDDTLAGGHGFDVIDGEAGDDLVHGDGTIDEIQDSGGGVDTLSYATGVTPGFTRSTGVSGFPPAGGERGVYLDLASGLGDNGVATDGGGADEVKVEAGSFERVIGTPFSDYIAGGEGAEEIHGGGGADAILGRGGNDTLYGDGGGDYLEGGPGQDTLVPGPEDSGSAIGPRDTTKVTAGFEAPGETGVNDVYMVGSSGADELTARYTPGSPASVTFEIGSAAQFEAEAPGCPAPSSATVTCALSGPLDALVLAGVGGDDTLRAEGFPASVSVMVLGGAGDDTAVGGEQSEDVLVDGPGEDELEALGGDDALMNNEGVDRLSGGSGNDLFLSNALCDGDLLEGGADRDNSSWAKLGEPVEARLATGLAGHPGGGGPECPAGELTRLQSIEDLEATNQGDFLYGDGEANQLLGRPGSDTYFALGGNDSILANSGDQDLVIDCGEGPEDSALIDEAPISDPTPIECEYVNQAPPESFEPPPLPPQPPPPPPKPGPIVDRVPPSTRITHRPPRVVRTGAGRRHRVVFAFAAEPGARFLCGLDRGPLVACRSPRAFVVGRGRHAFRVLAIDAAGNRDPSPARFGFVVRAR